MPIPSSTNKERLEQWVLQHNPNQWVKQYFGNDDIPSGPEAKRIGPKITSSLLMPNLFLDNGIGKHYLAIEFFKPAASKSTCLAIPLATLATESSQEIVQTFAKAGNNILTSMTAYSQGGETRCGFNFSVERPDIPRKRPAEGDLVLGEAKRRKITSPTPSPWLPAIFIKRDKGFTVGVLPATAWVPNTSPNPLDGQKYQSSPYKTLEPFTLAVEDISMADVGEENTADVFEALMNASPNVRIPCELRFINQKEAPPPDSMPPSVVDVRMPSITDASAKLASLDLSGFFQKEQTLTRQGETIDKDIRDINKLRTEAPMPSGTKPSPSPWVSAIIKASPDKESAELFILPQQATWLSAEPHQPTDAAHSLPLRHQPLEPFTVPKSDIVQENTGEQFGIAQKIFAFDESHPCEMRFIAPRETEPRGSMQSDYAVEIRNPSLNQLRQGHVRNNTASLEHLFEKLHTREHPSFIHCDEINLGWKNMKTYTSHQNVYPHTIKSGDGKWRLALLSNSLTIFPAPLDESKLSILQPTIAPELRLFPNSTRVGWIDGCNLPHEQRPHANVSVNTSTGLPMQIRYGHGDEHRRKMLNIRDYFLGQTRDDSMAVENTRAARSGRDALTR